MKHVLLTLIAATVLFSLPAFANDSEIIADQVARLEALAIGVNVIDLEGDDTYEMIRSLREQLIGDDSITIALNSIPDTKDEYNIGTTDNESALYLVEGALDEMEHTETPYSSEDRQQIRDAFSELANTNAIYAWNPFGSDACGSSFSTVVIIDPATRVAYEFIFLYIEGC